MDNLLIFVVLKVVSLEFGVEVGLIFNVIFEFVGRWVVWVIVFSIVVIVWGLVKLGVFLLKNIEFILRKEDGEDEIRGSVLGCLYLFCLFF